MVCKQALICKVSARSRATIVVVVTVCTPISLNVSLVSLLAQVIWHGLNVK